MSRTSQPDTADYQRLLLDGVPSILSYWGRDLRCRFANRAYAQWLDVDADKLIGMSLHELLGPDLFALNEPYVRAAFAGQSQTFERAVPRADGTERHSLITYIPDVADGEVRGVLVQVTDVTPLKLARDALKRSEEYLRELLAQTSEAVVVADEAGHYFDANAACCSMLGYSRDELLGKTFDDLISPQDSERLRDARTHLHAGERHVDEWTLVRKDGSTVPVEVRAKFLSDGRRVGFFRDVSDYKRAIAAQQLAAEAMEREVQRRTGLLVQATQELSLSEARLRAIFDSARDAIVTVDASQTIVQANPAAARMFRCTVEAMVGSPLDRFIPERYRHTHRRDMVAFGDDAHRARPMGRQREVTALRADGEEFPVEASISHLTINGQHLFTVIHRDITAQKKAQDDLEYSHAALQRLIAAQDKVQEEERARISRELHDDLQQTLAAIRIDLSALDYGLKKGLDASSSLLPELDALAEQAIVSTRRVIDDLRPKALDEVGLLPALQLLAEQFSQHYGIVCRVDVPEALSERLMKMPSLAMCLYRVTQESLNNVAKHSKATEVLITLVQTPADQVCLRIADNGRGIRSRDRYKPESSGLVGMRERVRAQNGVLRIDGRPGGGTVVEVAVRLGTPSWAEPFDSVTANPPSDATDARDSGFGSPDGDSVRARLDEAQLPRLLGRMASQTLQSVIDALEGSVAVIDRRGIIRFVNRAWLDFGARNGHPVAQSIGPGADYLEACRRAVLTDPSVEAVLQGLVELIEGRRTQFACDYACHSPETLRWFRMQVTPMSNGDILVMHFLRNEEPAGASRAAN